MFRKNERHQQWPMFGSICELPAKLQRRLEESWADVFYRECFSRIDESLFERLYADMDSRPNTPVNVLLSFEILKAGFGWSDIEAYDHFCFDLQVRYAVGHRNLDEGHFELRTVYNFRRRVLDHYYRTGQDLLGLVFEQVTDEQLQSLGLVTSKVRMDSTQIASNIRNFSRLHLLVEVLRRVRRMLSEVDRARYAEPLGPYVKQSSTKFVYGVSSDDGRKHIARIGQVMSRLVKELAANYAKDPTYALLQRVFEEQFIEEDDDWRPRKPEEFRSGTLNSPDDDEATVRRKRNMLYKGYVTNITETCADENPFQLIAMVQTAPNRHTDGGFLETSLLPLKRRLDLDECYTDGGYNKESLYRTMQALDIEHIQTGIQGHSSSSHLSLYLYQIERSDTGEPVRVTCPQGQKVPVTVRRPGRYHAYYDLEQCQDCPHAQECRAHAYKSRRTLIFTDYDAEIAKRRQRIEAFKVAGRNPRSAVESTVYAVKRPFGAKLPVRGRYRVHGLMVASAFMVNVRRIHRGWRHLLSPTESRICQNAVPGRSFSILADFSRRIANLLAPCWVSARI